MHPFIKEMHARVCLSIHMFCIFFDFTDHCTCDRKENKQRTVVPRTNKILLPLSPWPSTQKFTCSISSDYKLHIRLFQFLQSKIKPFRRIRLRSSTSPVSSDKEHSTEGVFLESTGNPLGQVREPDLPILRV